jgi:hypothetical protein
MKILFSAGLLLALAVTSTRAATYSDAVGDFTGGSGFLDITSVNLSQTAGALTFKINLNGDPSAAANNWGRYIVGFDTKAPPGGNVAASGGWSKNIQMGVGGMDYFAGIWPVGGELRAWGGSSWSLQDDTYGGANADHLSVSMDTSSVILSLDLAGLGLSEGSLLTFDVFTSDGASDVVLDALGTSASMSWNSNPYDSGANVNTYTVAPVPEPTTAALLACAGMLWIAARRWGQLS